MNYKIAISTAITCTSISAAAQMELFISLAPIAPGTNIWQINAELLNPTGTVRAAISDLGFRISGTGISNFEYNPAFDSQFFGPADVHVTPSSIEFSGMNTLPPLNNQGGPDSSNPLYIAQFEVDRILGCSLVGQVTGAIVGSPFDEILFYQNADGSAGTTPYEWFCVPAPSAATLTVFAGAVCMRRKRRA